MITPQDVLDFWLKETGPKGWYDGTEELDADIRDRFGAAWQTARGGGYANWPTSASGALAYIILLDQFPRNMFRDDGRAFATDGVALAAAKAAIQRGWDLKIDEPARQFFYLPLMHSENLGDQDRCVRLMLERMPETGRENLVHAKAHREVIRQFGRFPYRNAALGRKMTSSEQRFLDAGGYGHALREIQAAG